MLALYPPGAHGPLQAQDETVVAVVGVVDSVLVSQQCAKDGTDLQKMIPVLRRAGQAAQFESQDQAHMVQADLGEQALKAGSLFDSPAAPALVLVDHHDALPRPTERGGIIGQGLLTLPRFLVVKDLLRRAVDRKRVSQRILDLTRGLGHGKLRNTTAGIGRNSVHGVRSRLLRVAPKNKAAAYLRGAQADQLVVERCDLLRNTEME